MITTFILQGGQHIDENGKVYNKGDSITSSLPLDKIFKNKFIIDHTATQTGAFQQQSVVVDKPDIPVLSQVPFDEEGGADASSVPPTSDQNPSEQLTTDDHPKYGKDISADFDIAEEVGLKVYCKSAWCVVIDPENGDVMNEAKLRKKDVVEFLEQYLDDDLDDDDLDDDDLDDDEL